MNLKSKVIKAIAKIVTNLNTTKRLNAVENQNQVLLNLISEAKNTQFGNEHEFKFIKNYKSFKTKVPIRDYEALKPHIEKVIEGKEDVLWKGKPIYFTKTSGTTSGSKYIPISKESINHHIVAARNALFHYVSETNKANFFDGKMIFLQGSPVLTDTNGIPTGRLSGIVYHHVPKWLTGNRKPSYEANCIEDWETKIDDIVAETYQEDMRLISGIPPWCIMYFEKLLEKTGKQTIQEIFPNFKLFVYGGVNYEPYRKKIEKLIGINIDTIETYPASEGFFAYQNNINDKGLLLNTNAGIFYEFVEVNNFDKSNAERISLKDVKLDTNYVLIVSTNAGLWAYNTGDTVKFTSLNPYKIIVSGRLKHFVSAFGEHVIAEEVEAAIAFVSKQFKINIKEFTLAPFVAQNKNETSYYEWFIEFEEENFELRKIESTLDKILISKNSYYKDLREGNILASPKLRIIEKNGFHKYQSSQGKLGGQNKVIHLSNNRKIADLLQNFVKMH